MSRIYLAGPMTNIPWFNFPAFFNAAYQLRGVGHEVFNPAEKDIELFGPAIAQCPNGLHTEADAMCNRKVTYKECLKHDLDCILNWADTIALLPGWEKSSGVKAEKALADCLKLEVIYL